MEGEARRGGEVTRRAGRGRKRGRRGGGRFKKREV